MAVHIRLRRQGKKKQPTYRLVVADSRSARDGRALDIIGHYDPRKEPVELVIDLARARHWFKSGAKPTETARDLLVKAGIPEGEVPPVAR